MTIHKVYILINSKLYLKTWNVSKHLTLNLGIHHYQCMLDSMVSFTLIHHSFLLSFLGGIQCLHRSDGWRFLLVYPHTEVHRKMSFMSSSLLRQQCPSFLVCLTWVVCVMGGKCLYSCSFVGCYYQDLFKMACSILV